MQNRLPFLAMLTTVASVVSIAFLMPTSASGQTSTRPHEIGRLPVVVPPGVPSSASSGAASTQVSVLGDPDRRRLYQFYEATGSEQVTVFGMDSYRRLAERPMPRTTGHSVLRLHDPNGGRIFQPVVPPTPISLGFGGFAVIDQDALEADPDRAITHFVAPDTYENFMLLGTSYDAQRQKILLYMKSAAQAVADGVSAAFVGRGRQGVYVSALAQWDAKSGKEDWFHVVNQCTSGHLHLGTPSNAAPFYNPGRTGINIVCGVDDGQTQIVTLPVDATGKPTSGAPLLSIPGPAAVVATLTDESRHLTYFQITPGYLVIFDWVTGRVRGTAALRSQVSSFTTAGLDPESGRLAVQVEPGTVEAPQRVDEPGGLLLLDGYLQSTPQALAFREFADSPGARPPVVVPARPGKPRLVVTRPHLPKNPNSGLPYFRVIADPVPLSEDPPPATGSRTSDVDEADGRTERSYAGEAEGYGVRGIVAGGLTPMYTTPVGGENFLEPCPTTPREAIGALVRKTSLSDVLASVSTKTTGLDGGTRADAESLARCWPPRATGGQPAPKALDTGIRVEAESAECSGDQSTRESDPNNWWAEATAQCEQAKERVAGRASHSGFALGPVSVGRTSSQTSAKREAGRGLVVRTDSSAEDIVISLDAERTVRIGRLVSTAETWSNGRRPRADEGARASFTAVICGVEAPNFTQPTCQKPDQAVKALNDAGRNRFVFSQPQPDPSLSEGTPDGYLAGVQRRASDVALTRLENGDTSFVVPALEMQFRKDNHTTYHRYILQLAGVRAVSAYGISVLPTGLPDDGVAADFDDGTGSERTDMSPELLAMIAEINGGPVATAPSGNLFERIARRATKVLQIGWDLLVRSPADALLLMGTWSIVAVPAYLALRRRRLLVAS